MYVLKFPFFFFFFFFFFFLNYYKYKLINTFKYKRYLGILIKNIQKKNKKF